MKQLYLFLTCLFPHALWSQTTHTLGTFANTFVPDTLVAVQGDSLHIVFDNPIHTFTQVSEETWLANGATPSGQWNIGPGVTEITIPLDASGIIHYVCVPHAAMGMKGVVIIELATGAPGTGPRTVDRLYPNPTAGVLDWKAAVPAGVVLLEFIDVAGRVVHQVPVQGDRPMDVRTLPAGVYTVRALDTAGDTHFMQRLVRE